MTATYEIYYDRQGRVWWAYWQDPQGNQITDAVHAHCRDECLIQLGLNAPRSNG